MATAEKFLTVLCDFSDLENINYYLVVNGHCDDAIRVNRGGCYLDTWLTQYTDMDSLQSILSVFAKCQQWFQTASDRDGFYPMLSFIAEFKMRGWKVDYEICDDYTDTQDYNCVAQTLEGLEVVQWYMKAKNL